MLINSIQDLSLIFLYQILILELFNNLFILLSILSPEKMLLLLIFKLVLILFKVNYWFIYYINKRLSSFLGNIFFLFYGLLQSFHLIILGIFV